MQMKVLNFLSSVMILCVCSHTYSDPIATEPADLDPYRLIIDGYTIEAKPLHTGKRFRAKSEGVFIEEFEFSLIKGYVLGSEKACSTQVEQTKKERDSICKEERGAIRIRMQASIDELTQKLQIASQKSSLLNRELLNQETMYKVQITTYYYIGGVGAVTILGLVAALIVN